jgi:hypothetical protein
MMRESALIAIPDKVKVKKRTNSNQPPAPPHGDRQHSAGRHQARGPSRQQMT